jgi:hypothetical protein
MAHAGETLALLLVRTSGFKHLSSITRSMELLCMHRPCSLHKRKYLLSLSILIMGFQNAVAPKTGAKALPFMSLLSAAHLFMDAR